ncbi:POK7 protein, partial [Cisticola juncidis]|nr:POK7 protein [Cisticola juncidis]
AVKHTTEIPHSPTGQAIAERANRMLEEYLAKQKQNNDLDVSNRLSKGLFTLNYLCLAEGREEPAVVIHHQAVKEGRLQAIPGLYVYYKDMRTGEWQGP